MIKNVIGIAAIVGGISTFSFIIGSQSRNVQQMPLLLALTILALAIQVIAFIPAVYFNTEYFYDLTGSLTFITITLIAAITNQHPNLQQYLSAGLVLIWAGRLGSFLFLRVLKKGGDSRFKKIKESTIKFFFTWLLQGVWVILTISPLLVVMTSHKNTQSSLNGVEIVGLTLWISGFLIESVADYQKSSFYNIPSNKGKFITQGLWSISRHPNYMGEVILWLGASIFAFSSLEGLQLLALISPVFVYILLSKVSGIPLLEKKADQAWEKNQEYLEYKRKTPVLFPFFSNPVQFQKIN